MPSSGDLRKKRSKKNKKKNDSSLSERSRAVVTGHRVIIIVRVVSRERQNTNPRYRSRAFLFTARSKYNWLPGLRRALVIRACKGT